MKISVIIPTWNRKKTINRAIKSVLNQSFPIHEILVCDDGSTDSTYQVIKEFENKSIKWISGVHSGLPAIPRNRGIAAAEGEWIAFLDSDDEWLPNKIEQQLYEINRLQIDVICTNAFRITPYNYLQKEPYLKKHSSTNLTLNALLISNEVICSSVLIKKSLLEMTGKFPEDKQLKAIEDYTLWLKVACLTPIKYLPDALINYYDNPSESVRSEDVKPNIQKHRVLLNLLKSSKKYNFQIPNKEKLIIIKNVFSYYFSFKDPLYRLKKLSKYIFR